jgi:hypothetical protein
MDTENSFQTLVSKIFIGMPIKDTRTEGTSWTFNLVGGKSWKQYEQACEELADHWKQSHAGLRG